MSLRMLILATLPVAGFPAATPASGFGGGSEGNGTLKLIFGKQGNRNREAISRSRENAMGWLITKYMLTAAIARFGLFALVVRQFGIQLLP